MPINLWEQSGSPTSYNPLPLGWVNRIIDLPRLVDYVVTFKAKSATSKVLQILPGGTPILVNLTPEFREYTYTFNFTATNFHFYYDVANDIIIENLKVVQKPLPKTTINGIDGFRSGKWNLHANTTVIDDETLELNATGDNTNRLTIRVEPSTRYTLTCEIDGSEGFVGGTLINGVTFDWVSPTAKVKTFTTTSTQTSLEIQIKRVTAGKTIFKRPRLNEGDLPMPYEPKRGEQMVTPIPVKNLIPDPFFATLTAASPLWTMDVNASKTLQPDGSWLLQNTAILNGMWTTQSRLGLVLGTEKTLSVWVRSDTPQRVGLELGVTSYFNVDTEWKRIWVTNSTGSPGVAIKAGDNAVTGRIYFKDMQLEDGKLSLFQPYRISRKRSAIKKPIKNYLPELNKDTLALYNQAGSGLNDNALNDGKLAVWNWNASHHGKGLIVDVEIGIPYTFTSFVENNKEGIKGSLLIGYSATGVEVSAAWSVNPGLYTKTFTPLQSPIYIRFNSEKSSALLSPVLYSLIQLEEGSVSTSNEPLKLKTRRINGVPKKNLFKGFQSTQFLGGITQVAPVYVSERELRVQPDIISRNFYFMLNLEPNTDYYLDFVAESATPNNARMAVFNEDATVNISDYLVGGRKFNTGNRSLFRIYFRNETTIEPITYRDIQIEPGAVKTPYAPFRSGLRPARKGLEFSGTIGEYITCGVVDLTNANFEVEIKCNYNSLVTGTHALVSSSTYSSGILINQIGTSLTLYIGNAASCVNINNVFEIGRDIELKIIYDKTNSTVIVYKDGQLITGSLAPANINYAAIGLQSLFLAGHASSFAGLTGVLKSVKIRKEGTTILDYDLTNYRSIVGTKVKAKIGPDGTINGNPIQLNRPATR